MGQKSGLPFKPPQAVAQPSERLDAMRQAVAERARRTKLRRQLIYGGISIGAVIILIVIILFLLH